VSEFFPPAIAGGKRRGVRLPCSALMLGYGQSPNPTYLYLLCRSGSPAILTIIWCKATPLLFPPSVEGGKRSTLMLGYAKLTQPTYCDPDYTLV